MRLSLLDLIKKPRVQHNSDFSVEKLPRPKPVKQGALLSILH